MLTEHDAVQTASMANRQVRRSALDIDRATADIRQARSYFYPQSNVDIIGGYPLEPLRLTIPAGSLGTYPGTGPLPASPIHYNGNRTFTVDTYATFSQPISQIYKIALSVRIARNAEALAKEEARSQTLDITKQVRETYHNICLLETRLQTDEAQTTALQQALETAQNAVSQGIVLEADAMSARSALAQQKYAQAHDRNQLASAREQLNDLLGRDIDTPFSVEILSSISYELPSLQEARAAAIRQRSETQQARLQIEKASLSVRQERAGYLPDVSAQLTYGGFPGSDIISSNVLLAGFSVQWQNPWDFGRRKASIAGLKSAEKQSLLSEQDTVQKISVEVSQKLRSLQEAQLLIDAANASRAESAEKLRNVTNQMNEGSALPADVLKAVAEDKKQSEGYVQALAAYWNTKAAFDRSMGND